MAARGTVGFHDDDDDNDDDDDDDDDIHTYIHTYIHYLPTYHLGAKSSFKRDRETNYK